jgi:2-oxoglutarate dehydrogenase E1 component
MGAYGYMLMNFDLVKWRLASLKGLRRSCRRKLHTSKTTSSDAIRMVFEKNLFR